MNRKSKNTIEMPTGSDLAPSLEVGVCDPTEATIIIATPMPTAPTISKNLRPKRSLVQAALSVKRIPKVALRALIRSAEVMLALWQHYIQDFKRLTDLRAVSEHAFVDDGAVRVQGALASTLLTSIENERE